MFTLPHCAAKLTSRVLRVSFAFLTLYFLALTPAGYAQSVPGFQAPDKPATPFEVPVQIKAARGQAPFNRIYDYLNVEPARLNRLPALTAAEMKSPKSNEKILQVGVVRQLGKALNPLTDASTYRLLEGDVRVMGIVSEGALFTRVHFSRMSLPAGARVFVYSAKNPDDFYGPYEGHGLAEDGTFWTPPVAGDEVVIEYFTRSTADAAAEIPFTVSEISHRFKNVFAPADAGACNLEVTPEWSNVAKSVGMLLFVVGVFEATCTGTLLNDQASDQTPYLLTANHCFSAQTEAQSLRVYWNYNSGDDPPPGTPFTDGAHLLASGSSSDFTLVRLTGSLPGGLFFSGWDASATPLSTSITGIHHPEFSHKRIAFGTTNSNCLGGLPGPCTNFTHVGWNSGITEPGSSGSGLWKGPAASPLLVGTLTGGTASCANPTGTDEYGSFSATYPNISFFLSGTDCVTGATTTTQSFSNGTGSGSVNVTAPGGCAWTARSTTPSWLFINGSTNGAGNGSVNFGVSSNSGPQRSATILVGKQVVVITQAPGPACTPKPIAVGQTVNSSLTFSSCPLGDGSFFEPYSFNGVVGQKVSVLMTSGSFDTFLFLQNPDGSVVGNDDGGGGTNSRIPAGSGFVTLPANGTYTILANSLNPGTTGLFSLTLNGLALPQPVVNLSSPAYTVTEGSPGVTVTVNRLGDTSSVTSVSYTTGDSAGANNCNVVNGAASSRCDYLATLGTLTFAPTEAVKTVTIPIVNDSYAEGGETLTFTLSNVTGGVLFSPAVATITITDNDASNGANPIDISNFFVRQHYIDFLNREPDTSGLNFWTDQIESCTPKPQCTEIKRINVSAAFFLSIEFQETGYLVYRFYKSAYGNVAGTPVPVRLIEFLPDTQQIGKGVVVGQPGADQVLENNKVAYALAFVSRSRFTTAYPTTLTPTQFVDALFANAAVTPSAADRNAAIGEFSVGGNTADTAARGRALRRVAENSILNQQEKNKAFVLMQYFGYLRRNPNDPPELNLDFGGYNFWLGKLNQFNGNFVDAEMVKAFIISGEYRQRFGP
ncbi:MAG TPA: DUF4214 domain-containing protein [Pyrinomonadaceae bacterium]|jgi:hypothetical protein|nr:DUF4214 domain-containing protein [Pyrinomonadaceae bacterium]